MPHQNILSSEIKQGSNNEMYQASFIRCILNRVANKCLKLWWVYTKGTQISLPVTDSDRFKQRWGGHLFFCCVMFTIRISLIV